MNSTLEPAFVSVAPRLYHQLKVAARTWREDMGGGATGFPSKLCMGWPPRLSLLRLGEPPPSFRWIGRNEDGFYVVELIGRRKNSNLPYSQDPETFETSRSIHIREK